jgi:histidine triad (HIT) family protein
MKGKAKTKVNKRIKAAPCIFCRIVAGKAEAYPIYEDEFSLGILDVYPFTQGHCLVLSKRHVPWWHDLTEAETKSLFSVSRIIARKLKKAFKPDFVCMYARGRRIPHTHIFLVPTFSGDLLDHFFNALERAQEFPDTIGPVKRKKALKKSAGLLKSHR